MQRVYVVIINNGLEYEENFEWIEGIYFDKVLAEKYVKLLEELYPNGDRAYRVEEHIVRG